MWGRTKIVKSTTQSRCNTRERVARTPDNMLIMRASCDMQTIKNHCGRQLEKCGVSWTFVTLTVHPKTGLELPKCSHIILFFFVWLHTVHYFLIYKLACGGS